MNLEEKVQKFITEYELLEKGNHVIVGLSGGADSVCLLLNLLSLQKAYDLRITAVHIHHGIRGEDADQDEAFVQKLCQEKQVPLYVSHFDIPAMAKEKKMSEEEAGRMARYHTFEDVRESLNADCIAVAHHAQDVAETMLFFLSRGTSIAGLTPMLPKRGHLIRPLLGISREEIEDYLKEKNQSFCQDHTNEDVSYSRNRIRKEVIPVLEMVNEEAVKHFFDASMSMMEASSVLEDAVKAGKKKHIELVQDKAGKEVFVARSLMEEKPYVKKAVLLEALSLIAGHRKDLSKVHIQSLEGLFDLQVGRRVDLPYGVIASREYEGVRLRVASQKEELKVEEEPFCQALKIPGETVLDNGDVILTKVFDAADKREEFPQNTYTKWFDYDIIGDNIIIRHSMPDDYMVIHKDGSRKKLKSLFVNEKIALEARGEIYLLCTQDKVWWAVGVRMGEEGKINQKTKHILEIIYQKVKE